jgi:hypothetical protein
LRTLHALVDDTAPVDNVVLDTLHAISPGPSSRSSGAADVSVASLVASAIRKAPSWQEHIGRLMVHAANESSAAPGIAQILQSLPGLDDAGWGAACERLTSWRATCRSTATKQLEEKLANALISQIDAHGVTAGQLNAELSCGSSLLERMEALQKAQGQPPGTCDTRMWNQLDATKTVLQRRLEKLGPSPSR